MRSCSRARNVTDVQWRTETSMAAAQEKSANFVFDSWKCEHCFGFIWSESKNLVSGCTCSNSTVASSVWTVEISYSLIKQSSSRIYDFFGLFLLILENWTGHEMSSVHFFKLVKMWAEEINLKYFLQCTTLFFPSSQFAYVPLEIRLPVAATPLLPSSPLPCRRLLADTRGRRQRPTNNMSGAGADTRAR